MSPTTCKEVFLPFHCQLTAPSPCDEYFFKHSHINTLWNCCELAMPIKPTFTPKCNFLHHHKLREEHITNLHIFLLSWFCALVFQILASPYNCITMRSNNNAKSIPKYKSYSLYKAGHLYRLCVWLDSVLDWSLKLTPSCSVRKFVYWYKLSDMGYQCAGHCQRSTQSVGGCYDSHRAWLWA